MLLALVLLHATAPAACPTPAPLPPELAGWSPPTHVSAAPARDQTLTIGRGAIAGLRPSAKVALAVPTGRAAAPGTASGLFAFTVPTAGRYRVALGAGAWIDVARDGQMVASVAHGHGAACSPVRKMVDFDLQPGAYNLQVVGNATPIITLMIARLP